MRSRFVWACMFGFIFTFPVMGQQSVRAQIGPEYKKWLNEDVRWIMTAQERSDFLKLATADQRDKFVVNFWARRNPNPGHKENSFKEEHYRRMAYANQHFAARLPGWLTDRGRIYVVYGPPDWVDSHPEASTEYPFAGPHEIWHYGHVEGVGDGISIKFIDDCRCGAYEQMTSPAQN
jgi:GWxTD domain-containing protein